MTTDADAYQRLARALDAHRGDADAYRHLGEQLTARRHLSGLRYGNRKLFVRERLLPLGFKEGAAYKLVYDLESGKLQGRDGFSAGNMLALADAYGITPDELISVLDGGELGAPDPEPAPEQQPVSRSELDWARADPEAVRPYQQRLWRELYELLRISDRFSGELPPPWTIPGVEDALDMLSGRAVFGDKDPVQANEAEIFENGLSLRERLTLIAVTRSFAGRALEQEHGQRAGLAAG